MRIDGEIILSLIYFNETYEMQYSFQGLFHNAWIQLLHMHVFWSLTLNGIKI